jgi:hypothetical protein
MLYFFFAKGLLEAPGNFCSVPFCLLMYTIVRVFPPALLSTLDVGFFSVIAYCSSSW